MTNINLHTIFGILVNDENFRQLLFIVIKEKKKKRLILKIL